MHRMIRNVVGVVLGVAVISAAVPAQGQTFGGPVNVLKATTVKELYDSPEMFVGKTIRVDGVVTAVCEEMGCWVAVRDLDGQRPEQTVRFQAEHDGKIVFPITLKTKGGAGSFQGEFVKIGANDHEANEAAAEHAQADPKAAEFGNKYQIRVTGAVITPR
jgi:hypothetical protein